jgi:hypothetical protein
MTPQQIDLARHALGLGNGRKQSYRNSFVAGPAHPDYVDWMKMVESGDARRRDGTKLPFAGNDLFHLNRSGAEKALQPGETLDPEDWQ